MPAPPQNPHNPQKGRTGLSRLVHATGYSIAGMRTAYRQESAFRQEFWLAVVLIPASFWLGRDWIEVALLAGTVWIVLIVELLNSGIEAAIDRISPEWHELAGRAKDYASAAVLLSLVLCAAVWLAAIWQRWGA